MPNPTKLIFIPPAGGTVDWSSYFLNIGKIQRRIESDKPGEAGAIMFDTVTIEMPVSKTGSYFSESSLFGGSSKPKYHVQIKKHISGTDYQLFEGLIDLDSLKFTRHGTVQFDCYDKLSALKFYPTTKAREKKSYKAFLHTKGKTQVNSFLCRYVNSQFDLYISLLRERWDEVGLTFVSIGDDYIPIGSTVMHPDGFAGFFYSPPGDRYLREDWFFSKMVYIIENGYTSKLILNLKNPRTAPGYNSDLPVPKNMHIVSDIYFYDKYFYGVNIHQYSEGSLDAFKMLEGIIKSVYPNIRIINRTGSAYFPISFGFFLQTVNMPFDRPILEAIKYLASSMRVYVYINRSGQFIIDKWPGFGSTPSTKPDLSGYQTEDQYAYSWDKLVDKVTIKTVAADGTTTEAIAGTEYKNPVNTLERTVFASGDSAQTIANQYYSFYGKRHRARSITRKLDATVAQLDLTNWIDVGDKDFRNNTDLYYFIEKMSLDVMNDTVDLDLVSVKTFDV